MADDSYGGTRAVGVVTAEGSNYNRLQAILGRRDRSIAAQEMWRKSRVLSAEGFLKVYSYFWLILVGLKLLEIAKVLLNKEPIRLRVIPELGLIAVSQKIVAEDSNGVSALMLWYGIFRY